MSRTTARPHLPRARGENRRSFLDVDVLLLDVDRDRRSQLPRISLSRVHFGGDRRHRHIGRIDTRLGYDNFNAFHLWRGEHLQPGRIRRRCASGHAQECAKCYQLLHMPPP